MDNLPEELQFSTISSKKGIITNKEQREILPSNQTTFNVPNASTTQMVFRIPCDENYSIDCNSGWIIADFQIQNIDATTISAVIGNLYNSTIATTGANYILPIVSVPDSFESCIDRAHILIQSSELERIEYYQQYESMKLAIAENNSNYANFIGTGAMFQNLSVLDKTKILIGGQPSTSTVSNIIQVAFPLRHCAFFNQEQLLPGYLLGNSGTAIEMRLFLTPAKDLIVAGTYDNGGTAGTCYSLSSYTPMANYQNLTYSLSNVRLNINYVQCNEEYRNSLTQYLISNNLELKFDTAYLTSFTINPSSTGGWVNQNISVNYSNINRVILWFNRQSEMSNSRYHASDRLHFPETLSSAKLTINGRVIPSVPIVFPQASNAVYDDNTTGVDGRCGVSGVMSGQSLQYLLKAQNMNQNSEVFGQFNHQQVQSSFYISGNGAVQTATSSFLDVPASSGSGLFYSNNKAVWNRNITNPLINEQIQFKTPTYFAICFDLQRSNYDAENELSGYNSSTSGILQVGLQFSNTTVSRKSKKTDGTEAPNGDKTIALMDTYTCYVAVEHTRLLQLSNENTQIIY